MVQIYLIHLFKFLVRRESGAVINKRNVNEWDRMWIEMMRIVSFKCEELTLIIMKL